MARRGGGASIGHPQKRGLGGWGGRGRPSPRRDMTEETGFGTAAEHRAQPPLRLAVIDTDSGLLRVLGKRLDRLGWEYRVLGRAVPVGALVAMRLGAVVVDPLVVGAGAWEQLGRGGGGVGGGGGGAGGGGGGGGGRVGRVCGGLRGLGVVVWGGRWSVAQRVRGLRLGVDDWVTKPCHPEELIARVEAVVRRRRRRVEPRV